MNDGGDASRLYFASSPDIEVETPLIKESATALAAWAARPGEIFTLSAPGGVGYRARLVSLDPPVAIPFVRLAESHEGCELVLCQALPARERFELILEKLTELGAARIVPFSSRHSLTLKERDASQRKSHRVPYLLHRVSCLCRRKMLPVLSDVLPFEAMLQEVHEADLALILDVRPEALPLRQLFATAQTPQRIALLVGPEGGFAPEEIAQAQQAGAIAVSLGQRILRTESAAIVTASLLQYRFGDLG